MKTTLHRQGRLASAALFLLLAAAGAASYQSASGTPMVAQPPARYFGDEFAEAQRELSAKPVQEMPPTF